MAFDNRSPEEVLNDAGYFRVGSESNGNITYASEGALGAKFNIKFNNHTADIEVCSREYPGAPPLGIWIPRQMEERTLTEWTKDAVQFAVGGEAKQELGKMLENRNALMTR